MKIESSFTTIIGSNQPKSVRERQSAGKDGGNKDIRDDVDLTVMDLSARSTPITSYSEAFDLAKNIDSRRAGDAHTFSGETAARLTSLI